MNINLCRICEQFPPAGGGLSPGIFDLSVEQHRAGHNLTIITRSSRNDVEFDAKVPFQIIRIPSRKILDFSWKAYDAVKKLDPLPHIVHTHGPSAFTYLKRRKKNDPPLIHTVHSVRKYQYNLYRVIYKDVRVLENKIGMRMHRMPKTYNKYSFFINKELVVEKYICRNADHLLVVAKYFQEQLMDYYDISEKQISVVYNGSKFEADDMNELDEAFLNSNGINCKQNNILYVGRTDWNKRVHLLIEAMELVRKKISGACLIIVGEGEQDCDLQRIINKLSLNDSVKLIGWVPHKKLPNLYKAAKCFCLPSYSEGLSKALIEAISMKIPVVCSANPSHREILNNGQLGLLVIKPTPEAWAQSIEKILKNGPEIVERAEKASIILDEKYRWGHVVQRINGAYQKLLDKHAKK